MTKKFFVIDASTTLKWVLEDEINSKEALTILADYNAKKISLLAPDLWIYEVANGLRSIYLRKKITAIETSTKLSQLMTFSPKFLGIEPLIKKCMSYSLKYDISIYDSAYLTLALENNIALITADMKLVNKLKVFKKDVIIPLGSM